MVQRTLAHRVELLESRVESLERLPDRVHSLELQILRLDENMRFEFSATREGLLARIDAGEGETRRQMRVLHEDLVARIALLPESQNDRQRRQTLPALRRPTTSRTKNR